jgi:hypothetical protein
MLWEVLGAAVLGFVIACAAARQLPERLPNRPLVLATGPTAAVVGGLVCWAVLGSDHAAAVLVSAAAVSVAILSLLLSDGSRPRPLRPKVASPPQP